MVHAGRRRRASTRVAAGATAGEVDRAARDVVDEAGYEERSRTGWGMGWGWRSTRGRACGSVATDVLPTGRVVTVEPGVYLPGLGGVRIEDMVVVRDGSGERLPAASRELLVL